MAEAFEPQGLGQFNAAHLTAVVCGLALHFLFNKFEKNYMGPLKRLLFLAPLLPTSYTLSISRHSEPTLKSLFKAILEAYIITYSTLISSIIIYRLSPIHPLANYPGPLLARCSKFWAVYHTATGKMHRNFLDLHQRYGPVVRIGPNELSFCDVDVIQPILGTRGLGKGPMWDGRKSPHNKTPPVIGIRDTAHHLQRRKMWNKALNTASVRKYESALRKRLDQLLIILQNKANQGAVFDMAKLLTFFSYDFMGDIAFGGGFELMKDGDKEGLWRMMERGLRVQAYTQHIPWASPILYSLPGMGKAAQKLVAFVITLSRNRIKRGMQSEEDLSSHLLDEASPTPNPLSFNEYMSNAFLAIFAGSDAGGTVLSCILYHILIDKSHFIRLRNEIDEHFPLTGNQRPLDDSSKLRALPFLDAVINEALRLQPPLPTGLQRATDSGTDENMIGSYVIPKETAISIPPYVIHRDARYFSPNPNRFWPDRWIIPDNDKAKINVENDAITPNHRAFIPYSIGPMNCAGKLLAQLQLAAVVAHLVQTFDMKFEPDWNPESWENELEDYFLLSKGVLPIVVKERNWQVQTGP